MSSSKLPFMDTFFLDLAQAASATVGRVMCHDAMKGNGFMISDKLLLTNNHIIHNSEVAEKSIIEFSYELDYRLRPMPTTTFKLAPEKLLLKSPEDELDFAIVAVGARLTGEKDLSDFGFCPLKGNEENYSLGEPVNIIQHPGPEFKKINLRNSQLVAQSEEVLHYYAALVSGSSGAPVFNDRFEPVALHHYGCPSRIAFGQDGKPGPKQVAEGIRISAIVNRITSEKSTLDAEQRRLIDTALAFPFRYPSLLNLKYTLNRHTQARSPFPVQMPKEK